MAIKKKGFKKTTESRRISSCWSTDCQMVGHKLARLNANNKISPKIDEGEKTVKIID